MTQGSQEPDQRSATPTDEPPLHWAQRLVAGVLAVATAGAGATATFVEGSNEGGAPLLIGVGALFGYLALTGQRLTRLEAGGAKAELARTRRVIEDVITDPEVADEAKAEIVEAVSEQHIALSSNARRVVDAVLDSRDAALRYERGVADAIGRLRPGLTLMPVRSDGPVDFMLSDGTLQVPVTIKLTSPPRGIGNFMLALANELMGREAQHLVVVNRPVLNLVKAFPILEGRLLVAVWNDETGDEALEAALAEIFGPRRWPQPRAR